MTDVAANPARARGGGRAGRAAMRAAVAGAQGPAFIRREIPPYALLGEEGLALVAAKADQLLAEIGIEIRDDEESLRLFRDAGATVDGVTVRFDPGHVQALCATAPREFTQHARNASRSVQIGGDNVVLAPTYGSPFVRDLPNGRRYGTLADFQNFVKLAYATPWLHHSGGTVCEPTDVPVNKRHLDMVYAHLRFSDKAFMGSVTAPERAADSIEMARLAFGADFVDGNCVILGNVNVNSPLVWDATMTG
ncbi:MAG: trimethylamine methyltransferase family protein, partial [Ilumatobacteraceae bacterium]|nr:trimethylamine methyltransferase family protein [Ilumatobacteraceae bacterium]